MKRHTDGGSLMVWGSFSQNDTAELATISTKHDSTKCQNYLQDNLLSVWNRLSVEHKKFVHDNSQCHVSGETKEWLKALT